MNAPQDTTPAAAPATAPSADKRMQRLLSYSTKNMIYSLVAVFALAFGVWALMPGDRGVQHQEANVVSVASYAQAQVDWPLYVPGELGADWTVTTVLFETLADQQTWRLGVVTPSDGYLALSVTDRAQDPWLEMALRDTAQLGEIPLDAPDGEHTWQQWAGNGTTALVLPGEGDRTTTAVVHGSATDAEMVEFVEQLEVFSE